MKTWNHLTPEEVATKLLVSDEKICFDILEILTDWLVETPEKVDQLMNIMMNRPFPQECSIRFGVALIGIISSCKKPKKKNDGIPDISLFFQIGNYKAHNIKNYTEFYDWATEGVSRIAGKDKSKKIFANFGRNQDDEIEYRQ